jgi:hypothetical protein
MSDPRTAIVNELSASYHGDELPGAQAFVASLPERIRASAPRLRTAVGDDAIPALVALLRELRAKPEHPVHADIAASSLIYWPDDPEMWRAFQALADGLIAALG